MATGFYVPNSVSGSYVSNQRNAEGSKDYQSQQNELNIQGQAALQDLGKSYAETINNAYASYLSNQRDINTSAMGQGYKAAYQEAQEKALAENVAKANLSTAEARSEIASSVEEGQTALTKQYETEVKNLDRVATSMNDYLEYVKSFTGDSGSYLTDYEKGLSIDYMYNQLLGIDTATAQSYLASDAAEGKSYLEWIKSQMKDTTTDTDWFNWLTTGGYTQFSDMINKNIGSQYQRTYTSKASGNNKSGYAIDTSGDKYYERAYTYKIPNTNQYGYLNTDSQEAQKLTKQGGELDTALNLTNKLETGELQVNDIVEYKNNKYIIKKDGTAYKFIQLLTKNEYDKQELLSQKTKKDETKVNRGVVV